jgi:flagellar FliL protein
MSDKPEKENSDENLPAVDGAAPAEGNKKKKLILILVPLVLLLGGGAGLYFTGMLDSLLGKDKAAATGEAGKEGDKKEGEHGEAKKDAKAEGHGAEADKKSEEGDKAEGEKKEGEGKEGEGHAGPAFLKVPDLIVNLTSEGTPRYLRLSVQLELANEADLKAVEAVLPRVIDQFQTYLRELRVQDLRGSKGMYRLQMELLSRVNAAAAPTEVKDVLFQEILIQ